MAQLPDVFNAKDNEKMSGFEPIPAGWYLAEIVKSEMKDSSSGAGNRYLTCQLKIVEGEYKDRYLFNLMNLVNQNQEAVDIARKELASICEACDIDEIEESTELHGITMAVRVGIKAADANWPAKNEIKAYKLESEMPDIKEADDSPFEKKSVKG